jgi:hypothetical protein
MHFNLLALFYGGPDQLMPLTSGLAAILALLLMFWNKVLVTVGKLLNAFKRTPAPPAEEPVVKE